ncbi:MAG: PDZ domain-containing protein, partial [Planctomycetaceae bacterium]
GIGVIVPLDPQKSEETAGVEWYDSGIGFAVPLEDVYAVLSRMQAGETLKPGRMGVIFKDLGPTAGEPIADRVRPGSPAYEAGLREGDRITRVDGRPVTRVPHVRHILGRKYAGDVVPISYIREGTETTSPMTLAATLEPYAAPMLGILPDRAALEAAEATGVDVRFVLPGSPAARAGIKRRDRITAVNGEPVNDAATLRQKIGHYHPHYEIELTLRREGGEQSVSVALDAMTADVPAELPSDSVPAAAQANGEQRPKTGRFVDMLDGDEQRPYWAYVPPEDTPLSSSGLVIWLHPSGDTKEAEVLKAWQGECDRRGIILIGPKTVQSGGWTPGDVDFVSDLVADIRERYTIDPLRIVLHGYGDAALMAAAVAFREREIYRGLSLVGAALQSAPPESHPDYPLQFHFVCGDKDPAFEDVEKTATALRELMFPVTETEVPDLGHEYPAADAIGAIARWVDALDRI